MNESRETLLQRYQAQLGTKFGAAFYGLYNDWALSLMRLNEFRELFSREENVSLLNAIAGGSFTWDIQRIFWDDLLLRVCRLTDPTRSARKQNLTVAMLPALCKKHDPTLCNEAQDRVKEAVEKAKFARDWRNRRIAHSDWQRVIKKADPLAEASLQKVANVLDAVHAVLNCISKSLLNEQIHNSVTIEPRAGAFLAYARQLVDSVQFIDALVDPDGSAHFVDLDVATAFLRKLSVEPTNQQAMRVIELREAARRFA